MATLRNYTPQQLKDMNAPPGRRKHLIERDITPAQIGKLYIKRNDKQLRDAPVAYTEDGKRVFAYNDEQQPICYSRRPGVIDPVTQENARCQSMAIMDNGRCFRHGGKALTGSLHPRATHLRTSESMPSHLKSDFQRALNDPDLLSLNHEIALQDVRINTLKEGLGFDVDYNTRKKLNNLITSLADKLTDDGEITEDFLKVLVDVYRKGINQEHTWKQIDIATEQRRRLVDTAHHRERDLKTMIKADQAMALITGIAATCKECIGYFMNAVNEKYILIKRDQAGLTPDAKLLLEEFKVTGIDVSLKMDFLSNVATGLSSLISKPRDSIIGTSSDSREKSVVAISPPPLPVSDHPKPSAASSAKAGQLNRANAIINARLAAQSKQSEPIELEDD
jgi:hypothetical protein